MTDLIIVPDIVRSAAGVDDTVVQIGIAFLEVPGLAVIIAVIVSVTAAPEVKIWDRPAKVLWTTSYQNEELLLARYLRFLLSCRSLTVRRQTTRAWVA